MKLTVSTITEYQWRQRLLCRYSKLFNKSNIWFFTRSC